MADLLSPTRDVSSQIRTTRLGDAVSVDMVSSGLSGTIPDLTGHQFPGRYGRSIWAFSDLAFFGLFMRFEAPIPAFCASTEHSGISELLPTQLALLGL